MPVKTYSLKKDGDIQLSKHFKVKEWKCKDGTDKILINTDVLPYLEKIIEFFNCSKAIIGSGYRTPSHDKKVGGSGSGPHTMGHAVDIDFYNQSGSKINTKYICCYAKDIGMNGVAKIIDTRTHLDMRPRKWYADESNNYKTVSNFYTYFKLTKEQLYGKITPVQRDTNKDQIEIKTTLNVRVGAGTDYISMGEVTKGQIFDYIETKKDEKYTWFKISNNQWVANNGSYLTVYEKEDAELMEELKKEIETLKIRIAELEADIIKKDKLILEQKAKIQELENRTWLSMLVEWLKKLFNKN